MAAAAPLEIAIAKHDPSSYANNREARVTHAHLDLDGPRRVDTGHCEQRQRSVH